MNFENLGLAEELLKAVASTGYTTPTPVQQRAGQLYLDSEVLRAAGVSLPGINLSGAKLTGINFEGAKLRGAVFDRADLDAFAKRVLC